MRIVLDSDRLEELLRAAYIDGFDDGRGIPAKGDTADPTDAMAAEEWPDSVTADQLDALKERVRNGGNP